ncbi:hypothetical protein QAD02_015710 [Eretmocerus hayati]|uniref:Uncharacterized protein n=1 Tax=Eretmocerus hayati TaxID=131215 RepID=A0ACC2P9Z3_9HYME|nr:hypothetical protein QAD02_015710 [Eretmocerus hayati]
MEMKDIKLQVSQALADKGQYEQALLVLETAECVMALWTKGNIYLAIAQQVSKSFLFKHYPNDHIKTKHRHYLDEAYNHLYLAALRLPSADSETREYLNKYIWNLISDVQVQLINARSPAPVDPSEKDFYNEHEEYIYQQKTDTLVNQLNDWNLSNA